IPCESSGFETVRGVAVMEECGMHGSRPAPLTVCEKSKCCLMPHTSRAGSARVAALRRRSPLLRLAIHPRHLFSRRIRLAHPVDENGWDLATKNARRALHARLIVIAWIFDPQ